ncbi:MAG: ABC transporter permease subunit [Planctomycetes bacterium]|nr:ABC transporter permease subunit [Planctomycetota bacterium]
MLNSPDACKRGIQLSLLAFALAVTLRGCFDAWPAVTGRAALLFLGLAAILIAYVLLRFQKALFAFLVRRFVLMIVTLVGITLVTFIIIRAAPGDPATQATAPGAMGQGIDPSQMAREVKKSQRELLGIAQKYTFTAKAVDPDGDEVHLVFDWGDGSSVGRTEFVPSGKEVEADHAWGSEGDYRVRCQAVDKNGHRTPWSEFARISIREANEPPTVPVILEAPTEVGVRDKIRVVARAADPDAARMKPPARRLRFHFHLGGPDLSPEDKDWVSADAPLGEDCTVTLPETLKSGAFRLRVRAVDEKGAVSDWCEPRVVVVRDSGNPLLRPAPIDAPAAAPQDRPFVVRVRVPEGSPECGIEIEFGEGANKAAWRSAPSAAGTVVEARHTVVSPERWIKLVEEGRTIRNGRLVDKDGKDVDPAPDHTWSRHPENEKRELKILVRCRDGTKMSQPRVTRVLVTTGSRPPETPAAPRGPAEGVLTTPVWLQYLTWLKRCVTLDFGRSISLNDEIIRLKRVKVLGVAVPVGTEGDGGILPSRVWRTMRLEAIALVLIYLIAIPIGIYSSTHHRSRLDRLITFVLFVLYSLPSFWVATMLIVFVTKLSLVSNPTISEFFRGIPFTSLGCAEAAKHPLLTEGMVRNYPGLSGTIDFLWHAFLPVLCLTYGGLAALSRYARSGMLEVVRQDYIRTARAKGLSENVVIFKHALRNGMIPILTLLANLLPYLIGGAIVIEFIFSIDGMGMMAFKAIIDRDYNVVMAVTTLSAFLTLLGILLSDILYVLVDPRISFESMESS